MANAYIEYNFKVFPINPGNEILIAELGEAGFESFVELEEGLSAYVQKEQWDESILEEVQILQSEDFEISYEIQEIAQVNWNEEWEKNFDPIEVSEDCYLRATFHQPKNVPYEIVIQPKMSFGTGHHETTFMMLEYILENNFENQNVLDMGCGTAVLAILAEKKGAKAIDAIDIDEWCVENSLENAQENKCQNINVELGDASILKGRNYNTIIANINRNILLEDMATYVAALQSNGALYMSGFYLEDLPIIKDKAASLGLIFESNKEKNYWVAAKFVLE